MLMSLKSSTGFSGNAGCDLVDMDCGLGLCISLFFLRFIKVYLKGRVTHTERGGQKEREGESSFFHLLLPQMTTMSRFDRGPNQKSEASSRLLIRHKRPMVLDLPLLLSQHINRELD